MTTSTGYALDGGVDEALFEIGESTGALSFKAAPNLRGCAGRGEHGLRRTRRTNNVYIVVVKATSGTGEREKFVTQTITVTVTDDNAEKPGKPDAPTVTTVSVSRMTGELERTGQHGPSDHRTTITSTGS